MKRIFRSKVTLILIYLIMAGVAAYLNVTAENLDLPSIIVTSVMFVVVLFIFCFAFDRFLKIDSMIRDLNDATAQIKNDFRVAGDYLWDSYSTRDSIFTNKTLARRYAEFRDEMERLRTLSGDIYHCDIEDYINQDLIDDTINRNVLNLVSGTMTGLGILGTFIGLTLGLQQFNTGTADEITTSIGPLIQGIKVAFHTSIYGMVFSLFFSFIYKNKMDQAYEALYRFLDAYDNFVLPDSKNESFRQLLSFEKHQTEGMNRIAGTFAQEISARVNEILTPQFDRMNRTITDFATVASEAQVEGLSRIVDKFIEEMDRSMGNTLHALGDSIRETVEWQQQDRAYMRDILNEIGRMTDNTAKVNELSMKTIEEMESYVRKLDQLQGYLDQDLAGIQQLLRNNQELNDRQMEQMKMFAEYEKQIGEFSEEFSRAAAGYMESLNKTSLESIRAVSTSSEKASRAASAAVQTISSASERNLNNAVRFADDMTGGMTDSAKGLTEATDRLTRQFETSMNSTVEAYNHMQQELESMIYAMDVLRRNIVSMNRLRDE